MSIMSSINTDISQARRWIEEADALLVSASNGLSIAEGYNLFADNEMFRRQFADYRERYGVRSVLEAASYPYASDHVRSEFYRRLRRHWVDEYTPSEVMLDLRRLVGRKAYFVVTSNGDMHLEKAGFDEQHILEVEGNFIDEFMPDEQRLRRAGERFRQFADRWCGQRLVVLELGIGSRNRLIKQPLMQLVARHPAMRYITLNLAPELYVPASIRPQAIALPGDLAQTLRQLAV